MFKRKLSRDEESDIDKFFGISKAVRIKPSIKTKKEVKKRYFEKIKEGSTKTGKKFIFCKSHGKGILIEEDILNNLGLKVDVDDFYIPNDKIYISKTEKEATYKLFLKVPPKLWFKLEDFKVDLEDGTDWEHIKEIVGESDLELGEVNHPKFGRFIAIRPNDSYKIDDRHRINIYPGNSVKNFGLQESGLLDFIEKNKSRLVFKSFKKGEKLFYRFYLKKIKNSFIDKRIKNNT